MKDKGGKQHCLPFCCFRPEGLHVFEKKGTSVKGCVELEDWSTFIHFVLGFKENSMQSMSDL